MTVKMYCKWANDDMLRDYHDHEWGHTPNTDQRWLEFVVLETFQAGLSWKTILQKRNAFREAFSNFDVNAVASYQPENVESLMQNSAIVRNRKKIESAIENARIAQALIARFGSLTAFFLEQPGEASDILLVLQKTFRFVGRTTAESIAFATGLLPAPHDENCWLRQGDFCALGQQ